MVKYKKLDIPKHKEFRIFKKFKLFYTEQVEGIKIVVWFDFIYELHQYTDIVNQSFFTARNRGGDSILYGSKQQFWEKVCTCSESITKDNYKEITKMLNASIEDRNLAFGLIKNNLPVTIKYIVDDPSSRFRELKYEKF